MAQKTNINKFRLKKKLMWWTISHYNVINTNKRHSGLIIFHEDLLLRKLIEGILKSFNILVSEIIISRKPLLLKSLISKNSIINKSNNNGKNINKNQYFLNYDKNNLRYSTFNGTCLNYFKNIQDIKNGQELKIKFLITYNGEIKKEKILYNKLKNLSINGQEKKVIKEINKYRLYKNIGIVLKILIDKLINRPINKTIFRYEQTKKIGKEKEIDKKLYKISLDIKEVVNPTFNVKLLADWIGIELTKNPRKHKMIIKNAIKMLKN